jgi:hypothetical protein
MAASPADEDGSSAEGSSAYRARVKAGMDARNWRAALM